MPADNPKIVIYVAIDGAKNVTQYGGTASAPVAKSILTSAIDILGIKPSKEGMPKEYNYLDKVIFISFYIENLEIVKRYLPNQRAQFLSSKYDETVLDLLIKYNVDFDVHHSALNKRIVDELHHKGIKVNCWTVNEKKRDPYHK